MRVRAIRWEGNRAVIVDQTKLPARETYITLDQPAAYAHAIERMQVRGAPLIGLTAAYGVAQAALNAREEKPEAFARKVKAAVDRLARTRPTAADLHNVLAYMHLLAKAEERNGPSHIAAYLVNAAVRLHSRQAETDHAIARFGAEVIPKGEAALTICNTGALATGGEGTALAAIIRAYRQKLIKRVYVPETRPRQQGLLTAWELGRARVEYQLIADGAVGALLARGGVTAAVVGADCIARNGDVANKIGTYQMAVMCALHRVWFIVAAPTSTFDLRCRGGKAIAIEERDSRELTHLGGKRLAPEGCKGWNPAFDVTPRALVTHYVSEHGVLSHASIGLRRKRP